MTSHHDESVWTHREASVNRVRLHYVEAGPEDGHLVLLLHGFPEFWYSWRRQIPALAAAGFRVIAPDLRGYNLSAKPPGVRSYRVEALVGDVAALIRHAGDRRAAAGGHDWGGVLGWYLPLYSPAVVDRLLTPHAPHRTAHFREPRHPYLSARLTEGLERWVPNLRVERLPDASHWVQSDAPERVNQLMLDFLRRP